MTLTKFGLAACVILGATTLAGCATPLNSMQKQELSTFRAKGYEVNEKDPSTGAVLGILPGGGSFYTQNYGLGIVNLLLWPASILWDPISGHDGAESINYYATKQYVYKQQSKEMAELEEQLELKNITNEKFLAEKRKIDKKYSADM
jgi:hypothetical protein